MKYNCYSLFRCCGSTCSKSGIYVYERLDTIDDYLKMTRGDILATKGKVTHRQAVEKTHTIELLKKIYD
jgi:hypothetical protein